MENKNILINLFLINVYWIPTEKVICNILYELHYISNNFNLLIVQLSIKSTFMETN